jgi:putative ABC transport system substrate-binding protein
MQRRSFLTLLGGAAAAWPLGAGAQPTMPTVGLLSSETPELNATRLQSLRQGLATAGFVEGRNVAVEYRWAEGHNDRLSALAADLVHRQVAVIVTLGGSASPLAAKMATAKIPIVFSVGADPVAVGLVASLNRPGGNLTGVSTLNLEVGPKRLELLHELLPTTRRVAVLFNPTGATAPMQLRDLKSAAEIFDLQLEVLPVTSEIEFASAFARMGRMQIRALVICGDPLFSTRSQALAELTVRHSMAAIYQYRDFADAGGLMSYGGTEMEMFHLAGTYTGRILRGEKPADLPVQQATKIQLIINLKTARTLGLTFPTGLLVRADEVIE